MRTPSRGQGYARNKAQSAFANLWDGLVGHWAPPLGPTGLTLFDVSGNGNHGALTNMDTADDWVVGERGWANGYDGVNKHINAGNSFVFDLVTGITVSCWIKPDVLASAGYVSKMNGSGVGSYGLWASVSAGDPNFRFLIDRQGLGLAAVNSISDPLEIGVWHHTVGTYDGQTLKVYSNGKLDNEVGTVATLDISVRDVLIGSITPTGFPFGGQIGPASIYDRALLPNEIADMSAGASPLILKRRIVGKAPSVGLLLKQSNMHGGLQTLNGGFV